MLKRIKALSVSALSLLLLSGCVLHPVKRTFYEPDSADGHVRGGHCRYLRTHSAVWRKVAGAQWEISFVDVPPGGAPRETLDLNLSISAPADAVVFDPHRLRLDVAGTSESLAPTFIDQQPDGPRDREGVARSQVSRLPPGLHVEFGTHSTDKCCRLVLRRQHPGQEEQIARLHRLRIDAEWLGRRREVDTKFH